MKKFHVMTRKGEHEYDIVVTETDTGRTYELFYSTSRDWSFPGSTVMKIKENDADSTMNIPKLGRNIDASVVNELSMMLKFAMLYGQEQYMDDLLYNVVPAEGYTI